MADKIRDKFSIRDKFICLILETYLKIQLYLQKMGDIFGFGWPSQIWAVEWGSYKRKKKKNMSDYFETQFKADLYSKFESVEMWRNSSRKDLHQTPLYYVPIEDMFDVIKRALLSKLKNDVCINLA